MKYIIMDSKKGDLFTKEFDSEEDAVKEAKAEWDHLSKADKEARDYFFVLESVNPDEDAEDHYDGNPVWEAK